MPHFRPSALLALLILTAHVGVSQVRGPALETATDSYLEPYLTTGNFSGSVLVAQSGEVLFTKGYGLAHREHAVPNSPQTAFHLASVSRVFTSTAALLLVRDGKLGIEDPVSKYIPDFPRGDTITLRHLLTFSAGFPNINSLPDYGAWSLEPQTAETLVARFRDLPLDFPAGEQTVHSNSNYNLLALIIERASGQSFGDYLERSIFTPLGMSRSGHDSDPTRIIPDRAAGYTPAGVADFVNAPWLDWSVKTGHGSIYSSVEDLLRFDRALASDKFLPAALVDEAFTEHFEHNGFGWFIRPRFEDRELYINGRSPGFGSYFGRLERQDLSVIVLGNLYNSQPTTIARDLMAIVLGKEFEAPGFNSTPLAPEVLEALLGDFQFGPDFYSPNALYSMTTQNGHLLANGDWLMPAGPLRFIHRIYGSEIIFERNTDDGVDAMSFDGFRGERVDPAAPR